MGGMKSGRERQSERRRKGDGKTVLYNHIIRLILIHNSKNMPISLGKQCKTMIRKSFSTVIFMTQIKPGQLDNMAFSAGSQVCLFPFSIPLNLG